MNIQIIDAESTYRRLLAEPDAAVRERLYREALVTPFAGLLQVFGGGGDALAQFAQWGMPLELFGEARRAVTAALVEKLAAHDAWGQFAQATRDAQAAFAPYADRIALDGINAALLVGDLSMNPLERGYTGFGGVPGYVMTIYSKADDYTLPRLKGTTVHELHHNVRSVVAPINFMQVTLAYYMIMEGLAEAFAAELYGEAVVGYYVTDFDEAELEQAKQVIGGALNVTGFNAVRGYIFGDALSGTWGFEKAGVPNFAGYGIGYRVVQAFLKRTGKTVAEATFLPAETIIAESGYFE
ncbi:MAG: hypothetical protein GC204_06800 [Chloroflexi bacterium]|nr:hypothetical protein [Chloroflexota bacterium]